MVANAWLAENSVLLCNPPCSPPCAAQHSAARHQARFPLVLKGRCWEWIVLWDPLHRACFGALTPLGHEPSQLPFSCCVGHCHCHRDQTVPATTEWAEEPEAGGYRWWWWWCLTQRKQDTAAATGTGEVGMAGKEDGKGRREGVATVNGNHALMLPILLEEGSSGW